jgi:hypothetical protein
MIFKNTNSVHQIVFLLGFPRARRKVEVIIHAVELSALVVLIWTMKLGTMVFVHVVSSILMPAL